VRAGTEICLSAHFVKRQNNDYKDAEAIAEAVLRPDLPVVQGVGIINRMRRIA
jgi:hypothetical protein